MWCKQTWVAVALALMVGIATAQGQSQIPTVFNMGEGLTNLEFVPVGNAGNAADTVTESRRGAVSTNYMMGKFEVTAAQYAVFLNAVVIGEDTHGLYNPGMADNVIGCGITLSPNGYEVASDWQNRPVNFVSWGDAARFVNWLHNGQKSGAAGMGTTENGAYTLDGHNYSAVTRNEGAEYFLPTLDEWYKAAYYDAATESYSLYPTNDDDPPGTDLLDVNGNNANYYDGEFALSGPPYTSNVGAFENSASAYGTFDQGGNVWEWNESQSGADRGVFGGGFASQLVGDLAANNENAIWLDPTYDDVVGGTGSFYGFRVATVPEPGSLTLLLLGVLMGFFCWRRRK